MAINVYKRQSIQDKGEWYDVATSAVSYIFPVNNLVDRSIILVRAYSKTGTSTPLVLVNFSTDAGSGLSGGLATVDTDTGSTANYSEIIIPVPSGAGRISLSSNIPAFVYVQATQLAPFAPLNALAFTSSQSVTISDTSQFVVLGGGGGGGGTLSGYDNFGLGGGGSGYIATGTVSPGTYSLTVGAGGGGTTSTGSTGGSTNFASVTATGGFGGKGYTAGAAGGAGGSGGGSGARAGTGPAGGYNGNSGESGSHSGGTGSGVAGYLFTAAASGGAGASTTNTPSAGGGVYAGGGGGTSAGGTGAVRNGGVANGFGGGGGGACSPGAQQVTGGAGAAGGLWVLNPGS